MTSSLVFRKGLDLKAAVAGMLAESYHSPLIEQIKADDYVYANGRLTVHLAREFGFCYGVDRAVDYAYLGVSSASVYPQLAERFELPVDHGAWIQEVTPAGLPVYVKLEAFEDTDCIGNITGSRAISVCTYTGIDGKPILDAFVAANPA